jgi:glycosyltransferase involved in cell wall biosynthesis
MNMVNSPAVSIVMPLYNKADQVLATVASVQAQTVSNWELVVVDDGSTDNGPALLEALEDPRINIHNQPNAGVSAARNHGIQLCRTELVAFLDADDLWHPEFLATILGLQQDFPEACWYATAYEIRHAGGRSYVSRLRGVTDDFSRGILSDYFAVASRSDPPVCSSAIAIKRMAIQAIDGFPVGISSGEDLLTWARLAVRYPLAYETRPLATFVKSGIERRPDPHSRVGQLLEELLNSFPGVHGMQAYLGSWCRMQAVMAMRFGDLRLARRMAWNSWKFDVGQWRNAYMLFLTSWPAPIGRMIDNIARRIAS